MILNFGWAKPSASDASTLVQQTLQTAKGLTAALQTPNYDVPEAPPVPSGSPFTAPWAGAAPLVQKPESSQLAPSAPVSKSSLGTLLAAGAAAALFLYWRKNP